MAMDMDRYLAYCEHSYESILEISPYHIVPFSYYWAVSLCEKGFPCRCGVPGHDFTECPSLNANVHKFVEQVLGLLKSKWGRPDHNKGSSCFNCHLLSFFGPMSSSSPFDIEHTNAKKSQQGICYQFPPHIIGPIVAKFRHRLYCDIVEYKEEKLTVDTLVDFLIAPIGMGPKPMARLQYLLVLDIFASNGSVAFPTHRFDRIFREDILRGSIPTPSTIKNKDQETLLVKIQRTLSSTSNVSLAPSQTETAGDQPDASGSAQRSNYSQLPPSQNPQFSFPQLGQEDPLVIPPRQPAELKTKRREGNSVPASQDPTFRFDTGRAPVDDILPLAHQRYRPSQSNLSQFDLHHLTDSTPLPSPSTGTGFSFGKQPGPSKQPVVGATQSGSSSRRQAESSGLSKSTPSRSKPLAGRGVLSRSTPAPSAHHDLALGSDMDILTTTPQALGHSVPPTMTSSVSGNGFRTPALPASHVPVTPTHQSGRGVARISLSSGSPLHTLPIIPPMILRYNPYPPPLHVQREASRKGSLPDITMEGTPETPKD